MNQVLNIVNEKLLGHNVILQYKDETLLNPEMRNKDISTLAASIGDAVLLEIAYIKNKQQPVYQSYINLVVEQLKASASTSELSDYVIKTHNLSDELRAFIAKGIIPSEPQEVGDLGSININFTAPEENIRSLFAYKQDAELAVYAEKVVNRYTNDQLLNIFNKYVSILSSHNENYLELNKGTLVDLDEILLAYIAVENITSSKPYNYSTMDDHIFYTTASKYTALLKNKLAREANNHDFRIERKQLIINLDPDKKTIDLQNEVYNEFLNNNGKVEAILGYIVRGESKGITLTDIVAESAALEKIWNDKVNIVRLSTIDREVSRFKVAYSIAMSKLIENEMPEDIVSKLPMVKNEILKETDAIVNVLNHETLRNIGKTCQILLSKLVFPNSKFEYFTGDMIEASETVPNISANDAASYASIKMVIRYLVDQLETINC